MKDASHTRHTSVTPLRQAIRAINRASCGALACYLATLGVAHAAPYVEAGQTGNATSWRSAEFNADWGLGATNADQAYAAGPTMCFEVPQDISMTCQSSCSLSKS
ncbi:hypothetical protein BKM20_28505 [Pseudomonas avellanae]|uniref:Autotransporter n=3 Tax=Pseudomonas syringae group TaxID=136849 RepID=A0A3M2X0T4_PSEA0|nr:autotransporter [Pseudomonas amygdali pv. morsprunorum str. M302280]KWS65432.1 hypothetical protein AL055_01205 [Pseudomonas amygdali pv. morsprunorum]PHN49490.1 hypothetical protein AO261_02995 [Pseudomonas avellanae]SOS35455.1 autotransporter [Pseudomonas syringae group genomosp. 3]POC81708.1 hypothetical protein BKM26_28465 [Pseudomonas avellanae]